MKLLLHHDAGGSGHGHGHEHAHGHEHEHEHGHAHEHPHGHAHEHDHGRDEHGWHWHFFGNSLGIAVMRWAPLIGAACLILWLASGIRVVGPAERGVATRFGRVIDDRIMPGMRFGLPVGIERLARIQISKVRRAIIGGGGVDAVTGNLPDPGRSQFFSGDRNIVDIQLSIQYVIAEPRDYLFAIADPDSAVRFACESALCQIAAALPVDEILTLRKAEMQLRVRELAQAALDHQRAGVRIISVSQERSTPPEKVADAFRAVTSARADRDRLVAEAEGYREDLLPKARGEAAGKIERAKGDAYQIVALAEARSRRFERVLEQAGKTPAITRRRMHAETVENILRRVRKVIVKPGAAGDIRLIEEAP